MPHRLIPAPLGRAEIGTIDVRDVATVAVAALTGAGHAGQSHDVTGPEALTMEGMAERLTSVLDREVRYADIPPEAARSHRDEPLVVQYPVDGFSPDHRGGVLFYHAEYQDLFGNWFGRPFRIEDVVDVRIRATKND